MKKAIAALLLLFTLQFLNAQTYSLDSLRSVLQTAKEDSTRVFTLLRMSLTFYYSKPDSAMKYAQQALNVAEETGFVTGQTQSLNIIANLFFERGNYIKALETHLRVLDIEEKRKNLLGMAATYNNMALIYQEQQDYQSAVNYYTKAKDIFEAKKKNDDLLTTLSNIGNIYEIMNQLDSALFYENKAHQLALQIKDQNNIGTILVNLGNISYKLHKNDLALQQYKFSIPFALQINDLQTVADAKYGIARIYKDRGLPDSSITYAKAALAAYEETSFPRGVADASDILSQLYETQHKTDSAYQYYKKATATRDTMFNAEIVRNVQIISTNEQLRKKEIETAKVRYRNKLILITSLAALGVLLLLALVLYRDNRLKQKANALLQQKNSEIDQQRTKAETTLTELKATQTQLIQREKMASLGELTAGIAHEIQNPLNFVNNFSETNAELINEMEHQIDNGNFEETKMIARNIKENEQRITKHGKRADAIIKSMLEHSRTSKGEKQDVDLGSLVDDYLRLAYHGFRAKDKTFTAKLETQLDGAIGNIKLVPQDIGRVLLNLFNNALYAMNEKKKQLNGSYMPTVSVSTKKLDEEVQIVIRDNGPGISQNVIDKIFHPFFTTKPSGHGTGLGLSLSYDIIKANGGELKVYSVEGEYAEFIILLPAFGIS